MPRPKQNIILDTSLATTQIAETFRAAMRKGLLGLLQGGTEFGTPTSSPFDTLDDDPPDFSVLADVPTSRSSSSIIHLYIWNRGTHRQVQVVAFGGFLSLGMNTGYKVNKFVDQLRRADPGLRVAA